MASKIAASPLWTACAALSLCAAGCADIDYKPRDKRPSPSEAAEPEQPSIVAYFIEPPWLGEVTCSSSIERAEPGACEGEVAGCEGNAPPRLGRPQYLVDGEPRTSLGLDARGADVLLLIPYEDADCNLSCGRFEERYNDPFGDGGDRGSLSGALPCSTADQGACLSMWLYFDGDVSGDYRFEYQVEDACGARSNLITGRISF